MRKCGNTWKCTCMNSIKALTSLKRKTRKTHKGAWKDGALKDLLGIHATAANSDQL